MREQSTSPRACSKPSEESIVKLPKHVDPKDRDAMERRPRPRGSGILLTEDWIRLGCVGLLTMTGTLAALDAYYPGGFFTLFATGTEPNTADEVHARTIAFTTLMMFQLFDVYNCRSRRRSAFSGFLENKWLLVAVAFSLGTHILVTYVPFLQTAFHPVPLSLTDWLVITGISSTLLLMMELPRSCSEGSVPTPMSGLPASQVTHV
jgi:Ca2+-transporting ATPase